QLLNPTPSVVANLEFRRALIYGLDRQQMVDTLQAGMTSVAHTFLSPNQPQYAAIEARVPRYAYDPARASQMLDGLGYRRGPAWPGSTARGRAYRRTTSSAATIRATRTPSSMRSSTSTS